MRIVSASISRQLAITSCRTALSTANLGAPRCLANWKAETKTFVSRTTIKGGSVNLFATDIFIARFDSSAFGADLVPDFLDQPGNIGFGITWILGGCILADLVERAAHVLSIVGAKGFAEEF